MPRYLFQTKRVRADWWDEDEWVEVKKLSGYDRDQLQGRVFQISGKLDRLVTQEQLERMPEEERRRLAEELEGRDEWRVAIGETNVAKIMAGVTKWNLYYADAETDERHRMPFNQRYVRELLPPDFDFIADAVDQFNGGGPAQDPKSSPEDHAGGAGQGELSAGDGADPHDEADGLELARLPDSSGMAD